MNSHANLMKRLTEAYDLAVADLNERFPPGSQVEFFIMHGQKKPSTGRIVGCNITISDFGRTTAYANIRVRHDQAKPGGRYPVREVSPENIVGLIAPTNSTNG